MCTQNSIYAHYLFLLGLGSPTNSTLLHSIKKNYLSTFPGLTTKLITSNLPPQKSTIRAHIKQEYQNLQSTKVVQVTLEDAHADSFPTPDTPNVKMNGILCMLMQTKEDTGKAYIDLTSRFPIFSARGNEYILVGYHYDANAIRATPALET